TPQLRAGECGAKPCRRKSFAERPLSGVVRDLDRFELAFEDRAESAVPSHPICPAAIERSLSDLDVFTSRHPESARADLELRCRHGSAFRPEVLRPCESVDERMLDRFVPVRELQLA